jgi:excisionase family DNA binding protein
MKTNTPSVGQKGWLTVPEVAQELRIPRSRCYELIQRGELPAVRIGEHKGQSDGAGAVPFGESACLWRQVAPPWGMASEAGSGQVYRPAPKETLENFGGCAYERSGQAVSGTQENALRGIRHRGSRCGQARIP